MLQELTNYRKQLEKTLHWLKRQQHCVRKPSKKKRNDVVGNTISHAMQALFEGMAAAKAIRYHMYPRPNFNVGSAHVGHGTATVGKTGNEQIIMRGGGAVIVEPRAMKGKEVTMQIPIVTSGKLAVSLKEAQTLNEFRLCCSPAIVVDRETANRLDDVFAPNCRFNFDNCTVGAELKHPDGLRHSIALKQNHE